MKLVYRLCKLPVHGRCILPKQPTPGGFQWPGHASWCLRALSEGSTRHRVTATCQGISLLRHNIKPTRDKLQYINTLVSSAITLRIENSQDVCLHQTHHQRVKDFMFQCSMKEDVLKQHQVRQMQVYNCIRNTVYSCTIVIYCIIFQMNDCNLFCLQCLSQVTHCIYSFVKYLLHPTFTFGYFKQLHPIM